MFLYLFLIHFFNVTTITNQANAKCIGLMAESYQRGNFDTRKTASKGVLVKDGELIITEALPILENSGKIPENKYEVFFEIKK